MGSALAADVMASPNVTNGSGQAVSVVAEEVSSRRSRRMTGRIPYGDLHVRVAPSGGNLISSIPGRIPGPAHAVKQSVSVLPSIPPSRHPAIQYLTYVLTFAVGPESASVRGVGRPG